MMWPLSESTETGLLSGAGSVFIAPCVLAQQALESDHLEKLQARYSVLTQRREHVQQPRELYGLLATRNTHISKDKSFAWRLFGTVGAKVCFSKPSSLNGNRISPFSSRILGIHLVQMTSLRECLAWFLGLCRCLVCDCLNWIAVKNWAMGGLLGGAGLTS